MEPTSMIDSEPPPVAFKALDQLVDLGLLGLRSICLLHVRLYLINQIIPKKQMKVKWLNYVRLSCGVYLFTNYYQWEKPYVLRSTPTRATLKWINFYHTRH